MSTVFVLVTDAGYFTKCKKTICDLRSKGQWTGEIVVICIARFTLPTTFKDFYELSEISFPEIEEKKVLVQKLHYTSFLDTIDGREINLINQWEKLHVFDNYFLNWDRVVFFDAGLRVLDNVHETILLLDYKDSFLAPDDGGNFVIPNPNKLFHTQISHTFKKKLLDTVNDFGGEQILQENYFLNCIWVYDTSILSTCSKKDMIDGILKYPICKTNEMALMNLFLHFRHRLWKPFPTHINKKILFDWSELNNPGPSTWRDYCFIKYPWTISFEDT